MSYMSCRDNANPPRQPPKRAPMTVATLTGALRPFDRIGAAITAQPERFFAWFLVVHLATWTLLPLLVCNNLQLDLIEDLALGREWQLGYWKHPPLPWWLADLAYRLSGGIPQSVYLLAQISMVVCFWAVWRLAREVAGPRVALLSVLILEGIHYYSFSSIKFAHDQGQLPFWALTAWSLYRALTRGRALDWALTGVWLALAFWSKYAALMLAATLFVFLIADRDARRCWLTPGPWIALAAFMVVIAPHALWLIDNDFLPFAYVDARSARAAGLLDHFRFPANFALSQFFFLLPATALVALLIGRRRRHQALPPTEYASAFAKRYVATLTIGPFLVTALGAGIDGRGLVAMWGYPFWLFFGLAAIIWLRPSLDQAALRRFAAGFCAIFVAFGAIYAASELFEAMWNQRMKATNFPGRLLAAEVTREWRARTGQPLVYAAGSMYVAGNLSVYAPDRPRLFIDGDFRKSPWVDPGALRRSGAVIVWYTAVEGTALPAHLRAVFPDAEQIPALELPWQTLARVPPLSIGLAIVRPRP